MANNLEISNTEEQTTTDANQATNTEVKKVKNN